MSIYLHRLALSKVSQCRICQLVRLKTLEILFPSEAWEVIAQKPYSYDSVIFVLNSASSNRWATWDHYETNNSYHDSKFWHVLYWEVQEIQESWQVRGNYLRLIYSYSSESGEMVCYARLHSQARLAKTIGKYKESPLLILCLELFTSMLGVLCVQYGCTVHTFQLWVATAWKLVSCHYSFW